MLTEVKNNYKSILRHFNFDESISSVDYKKQKLIEMAKRGEAKPKTKTKLGRDLRNYTCKSSSAYCSKFDKTIRRLAPNWFISTLKKKCKLIQMAKDSKSRPNRKTKEGQALCSYTNKSSGSYCSKFDKLIRKLAPNWFITRQQIVNQKRQKLIQIAMSGKPKPNWITKEGKTLYRYLNRSSNGYCPAFNKTIRRLRPDWFISQQKQIVNQKKQKLIQMAKDKKPRPIMRTKDGSNLVSYTNESSGAYCSKFDKLIRKLAPNWFITQQQIANQKKQKLIQMAKNGEARPGQKTKLGISLASYLDKHHNSYCEDFYKTIIKLAPPNWFRKNAH